MELVRFETTIGGQKTQVVSVQPGTVKPVEAVTHHILLIDRSGSTYSFLDNLIDNVQESITHLGDEDLISVGWFSGLGQFDFLVQGMRKGDNLTSLLDRYRTTVGLTCFSEVVRKSVTVAEAVSLEADQLQVTMFTDGHPCGVSTSKELTSIEDSIALLKKYNLVAFNAIGYGYYYNRDFLQTITSQTEYGETIHSSTLDQVLNTLKNNIDVARGLVANPLTIHSDGRIIHLTNNTVTMDLDEYKVSRLSNDRNQFYAITSKDQAAVLVNNSPYDIKDIEKIPLAKAGPLATDFFYAYATQLYYKGHRQTALDIVVNNIKDKYLADKIMNSFTMDEVASSQEALKLAALDTNYRMLEGKCPPNYIPAKNALCVLDVFNTLFSHDDAYYLPFSKNVDGYSRVTRKVTDEFNSFKQSENEVVSSLEEFIWNKDRLNLSISFKVDGTVSLNPRDAKRVDLPENYPSCIFRTHTFIKDGSLNIKKAEFMVDPGVTQTLKDMKVPLTLLSNKPEEIDGELRYMDRIIIDFSKLPVINRQYIDDSVSIDDLATSVIKSTKLEAGLKVARHILSEVTDKTVSLRKIGEYKAKTADQIQVLEAHGIRKDGIYGGIKNTMQSAEESDSYETRTITFYLKGCSSLPSIKDFYAMLEYDAAHPKKGKKPNVPGTMMIEAYHELVKSYPGDITKYDSKLRDFLISWIRDKKIELSESRMAVNSVKLAKLLTHDWFTGLEVDNKGNNVYDKDGYTVVLRADRTVEYI